MDAGDLLVLQTRIHARQLFVATTLAHLAVSLTLLAAMQLNPDLSRDSIKYDMIGRELAESFSQGNFNLSLWVDHGWYQLIGWIYFLIGPYLLVTQALNAVAMGAAAVLTYRIGMKTFRVEPAARVAAYTAAFFPSALYYTSLPLKEACSIFAVCSVVWGVLFMQQRQIVVGIRWIAIGLLITASLRVYLVFVYLGCIALSLAPIRAKNFAQTIFVFLTWSGSLALLFFAIANTFKIDFTEYEHLQYFDLEYINHIRMDMGTGSGKLFANDADAAFGEGLDQDIINAVKGVFFFFMSIDVFNIRSSRQMAAIPEMLFMIGCIPNLWAGVTSGWKNFPRRLLPLLLFTAALIAVYGGAATNMGAMYRWRLQALPFLLLIVCYGATVRRRGPLYTIIQKFAPQAVRQRHRSPAPRQQPIR
jgi:hypothetical protein